MVEPLETLFLSESVDACESFLDDKTSECNDDITP